MTRFFVRLMALILAVSVFAASAALVAQLRPESAGGWFVLALALVAVVLGPFLVYRAGMHQIVGVADVDQTQRMPHLVGGDPVGRVGVQ